MPMCNAIAAARACCACLAGFALVILSASLAEAQVYGPRTKIGANYQQASAVTSNNGIDPEACANSFSCYVLFQPAPQQKALIVQHVSCSLPPTVGEVRYGILITRKGQTFPLRQSHLVPVPTAGGESAVNSPVMHLLKPGERAVIRLFHSAAVDYINAPRCTIAGKLLQP